MARTASAIILYVAVVFILWLATINLGFDCPSSLDHDPHNPKPPVTTDSVAQEPPNPELCSEIDPQGQVATTGSTPLTTARHLARCGRYDEALQHYEMILRTMPDNYDAQQGKAFVLYWSGQLEPAKTLFQQLQTAQPTDPQNSAALKHIEEAQEAARWFALRPPPDSPPQVFLVYFEQRVARHPNDPDAVRGLARAHAALRNRSAAIRHYQHLLEIQPGDHDAQRELAPLLVEEGRGREAIELYRAVLQEIPNDHGALEALAHAYLQTNCWREARPLLATLAATHPERADYQVELARVDINLRDYGTARATLATVLARHPRNEEARLELARLELRQEDFRSAAKQFDQVLKQNPRNVEARLGRARVAYYSDDLRRAHRLATGLAHERPDDADVLFLLAQVERSLRHCRDALRHLAQAKQLAPDNPEIGQLEKQVRTQTKYTLRSIASYASETGEPHGLSDPYETGEENLHLARFGTTLEFTFLPRTTSYLSINYLPTSSPAGGIRGAAGAAQWFYRQDTRLTSRLTVRGGLGLARFGPGGFENVPGQSEAIPTATVRALALGSMSYTPSYRFRLDLDASRNAIPYTPTAARLGVMENRYSLRLNYFPTSRMELHLEYFFATYSSILYNHVRIVNDSPTRARYADHDQAQGVTVNFLRNLFRRESFRVDAGYQGTAYGYEGAQQQVWMGFFNPGFYQRHQLTGHVAGKLWKQLGYDLNAAVGVQQIEHGQALTRATTLSPALTCKVNERLTLGLNYTHYNSAQTLGSLRGNAVQFTTEWNF